MDDAELATTAFVGGYPLVVTMRTLRNLGALVGTNALFWQTELSGPTSRVIVAPNRDTFYSVAVLDLRAEPLVLTLPEITDRYVTYQFLDAWTDSFAYLGTRETGGRAGTWLVTPPGWTGDVPEGMEQVASPTPQLFLLGRLAVEGEGDAAAIAAVRAEASLQPLSGALGEPAPGVPPALGAAAGTAQDVPTDASFFDELLEALAVNPPTTPFQAALFRELATRFDLPEGGPVPGDPAVVAVLDDAAAAGDARIEEAVDSEGGPVGGWAVRPDIGRYGDDLLGRALVARVGWGANVDEEAVYPVGRVDAAGDPLSGEHTYRITFPPGGLPPVDAFWSLSVYGDDMFFTAHPSGRYTTGSEDPELVAGPDGSVEIVLAHEAARRCAQLAAGARRPLRVDGAPVPARLRRSSTAATGSHPSSRCPERCPRRSVSHQHLRHRQVRPRPVDGQARVLSDRRAKGTQAMVRRLFVLAAVLLAAVAVGHQTPVSSQAAGDGAVRPILFVHGFMGSGQQFETQALRFTSNGYAAGAHRRVRARLVGLPGQPGPGVGGPRRPHRGAAGCVRRRPDLPGGPLPGHRRVAGLPQQRPGPGRPGGGLREPRRLPRCGAGVGARPGGVGRGERRAPDAGRRQRAVREPGPHPGGELPGDVRRRCTSSSSAKRRRSPRSCAEPAAAITISGRAVLFPENRGAHDATLEVFEVDGSSGRRLGGPVATVALSGDGAFGPLAVDGERFYEFAVVRPGESVHHVYLQRFVTSSRWVRILTSEPDGLANSFWEPSATAQNLVVMRNEEWWGDQGSGSDRLAINGRDVLTARQQPPQQPHHRRVPARRRGRRSLRPGGRRGALRGCRS
jgi:hypothetical protein